MSCRHVRCVLILAVALLILTLGGFPRSWAKERPTPTYPVSSFLKAVEDRDPDRRRSSLERLASAHHLDKPEAAFRAVVKALGDPEPSVRAAAAKVLGESFWPEEAAESSAEHLIRMLQDDLPEVRRMAVHSLGRIKSEKAVAPLLKVMSKGKRLLVSEAATALGEIGSKDAVEPLLELLDRARAEKDEWLIRSSASALGAIGDTRAFEPVAAAYKEFRSVASKHHLLTALVRLDATQSVPTLLQAMQDPDYQVRRKACRHFFTVRKLRKDPRALPALISASRDDAETVRKPATWALAHYGEQAVKPLIRTLQDPSTRVRTAAANSLGNIGDKQAVPALIRAIDDEEVGVRLRACWALGEIGDQRAVPPLRAALAKAKSYQGYKTVFRALRALGEEIKWECPFAAPREPAFAEGG